MAMHRHASVFAVSDLLKENGTLTMTLVESSLTSNKLY